MHIPPELSAALAGKRLDPVGLGESGAHVWRCSGVGLSALYLKAAPVSAQLGLDQEAECMRWLRGRGVPVPAVREYLRLGDTEYLLAESSDGVPASAPEWSLDGRRVATALGRGLARLHATDATDCPFDRRISRKLDEAALRLAAGRVREDDFDEMRLGRDPADLLAELRTLVPAQEDLVLVHGDFCLPNVFLAEEASGELRVAGLIDCGRAGVGDRHQDLALAIRSLVHNLGSDTVSPFLHAYGDPAPDPHALEFFTALDEFF